MCYTEQMVLDTNILVSMGMLPSITVSSLTSKTLKPPVNQLYLTDQPLSL